MENYKSNDRKNAWNESFRQEHLFQHFIIVGHSGVFGDVSITLIDKTNVKDPKRKENYWMRTLKTYAPFELDVEDSVRPIPCRSINVTGRLNCLVFFGILVRLGTDLEYFSDMTYFFVFIIFFISLLLICYFMSFIFKLLLYYMLVLFPLLSLFISLLN